MKKYILVIILLLFCSVVYAEKKAKIMVYDGYPTNIKSSGKTIRTIDIANNEKEALYDLEVSLLNDDNLEITLDGVKIVKIDKIEPNEQFRIKLEINNERKYYFDKEIWITYKISNDEYYNEFRRFYTIKPVENFWFFTILSIGLVLVVIFIIIFIKLNKGENNVR